MFDSDDNYLPSITGSVYGGSPYIYPIRVDCLSGKHLRVESGAIPNAVIEAKFAASGSYTSLEGTGLDLTPQHGNRATISVRVTADASTNPYALNFDFIVD